MKNSIIVILLAFMVMNISCKKSRNCSCKSTNISTNTVTSRVNGASTKSTNMSIDDQSYSVKKASKKEMERIYNCKDHTTTSVVTQTTGFGSTVYDVVTTGTVTYWCEIK